MKRTCITCHHHLTERGRIVCGFDGKCEWGECYEPMRGSLEELQMSIDPWRKAMTLYEAKLLNRHDGIFVDVAIDVNKRVTGRTNDIPVISVYDKLHKTICSHIIRTDNPDAQSWLRQFMKEYTDGKETET